MLSLRALNEGVVVVVLVVVAAVLSFGTFVSGQIGPFLPQRPSGARYVDSSSPELLNDTLWQLCQPVVTPQYSLIFLDDLQPLRSRLMW